MATRTRAAPTTAVPRQRRQRAVHTAPSEASVALVRAAERLFAERGVDAVSLREVSAAAQHKNSSAAAYHFGNKVGLIDAILDKHVRDIHGQFEVMLDLVESRPDTDLRRLVEVLVLPVVRKLDDADGGRDFISISAQLAVSPSIPLLERPAASTPSATRLMAAMLPKTSLPPELMLFRMLQIPMVLYGSLVNVMRMGDAAPPRDVFVADLVDALTGLITTHLEPTRIILARDVDHPTD